MDRIQVRPTDLRNYERFIGTSIPLRPTLPPGRKRSDAVSGGRSETGSDWTLLDFRISPRFHERDLDCEDCYGFGSGCKLSSRDQKGEVGVLGWAVLNIQGLALV
jgi:hypothetical protein